MRTLGRLLRLSLAPSAIADVLAGVVLAHGLAAPAPGAGDPRPWLLVLASLCVYHGGMALNDWADRVHDGATRPGRPVPSGAVPAPLARLLGLGLLLAGPLVALAVDREVAGIVAGVALLAAAYDLGGRGPWVGPLLLAACRTGNLLGGAWLGSKLAGRVPADEVHLLLPLPLLYGAYVFAVSRLGRMEDAEDDAPLGRRPPRFLAALAAVLLVAPVLPLPWHPDALGNGIRIPVATLVAAGGAFGLLRLAFRPVDWTRPMVMLAMGMCLRRLLVFTATVAALAGTASGYVVSLGILCGFPVSYALRRVFPPS